MRSSGGRLCAGIGMAGPRVSSPFFPWRGYWALAAHVASRRHLPAGAAVAVGLVLWSAHALAMDLDGTRSNGNAPTPLLFAWRPYRPPPRTRQPWTGRGSTTWRTPAAEFAITTRMGLVAQERYHVRIALDPMAFRSGTIEDSDLNVPGSALVFAGGGKCIGGLQAGLRRPRRGRPRRPRCDRQPGGSEPRTRGLLGRHIAAPGRLRGHPGREPAAAPVGGRRGSRRRDCLGRRRRGDAGTRGGRLRQPVPALPGRRSGPGVPDPIERDAPHRQGAVRAHPGEQPAGRLGRRGCDGEGDFSLGAFDRVPVEEACPDRVGTAAARGKGAFDGGSRSWQR